MENTEAHDATRVDETDMIFARRLRCLREKAGMTQQQLADRMWVAGHKMHRSAIAKIEGGDRPVSIGEAYAFAQIMGTGLETLITEPLTDDERELRQAEAHRMMCEGSVRRREESVAQAERSLREKQMDLAMAQEAARAAAHHIEVLKDRLRK